RMETQDLFADQVEIGGPETFTIHCAHVGAKRIEPDIKDMRRFVRHRDAPLDGGPAHGDVLEALLYKRDDFVAARFGLDEVGLILVELEQPIAEGRELEVEIFFRDSFCGTSAIRA